MQVDTGSRRLISTPAFIASVMALAYVAITLYITIHLLHDSYNSHAMDLGAFTQILKYTLQGKMLWHPSIGVSELAHHFSPVLFFLVPVYWLFPYVQTLLVVQGIVLGFSGYLVYVLARDYKFSPRTSLAIEALFFINPLVWGVALFDFHPEVFAILALFVMLLGLRRKSWFFFTLGLVFSLISKEYVIIVVAVFGITMFLVSYWRSREISRISLVLIGSALVAYAVAIAASAIFSNGESPRILSYFSNRYTYTDQSIGQAIWGAIKTSFSSGSLFLFLGYFGPLAFLPLLSVIWAIPALLVLLSGMLSTNIGQHNQLLQYPSAAIPFLFMAFINSLQRVKDEETIRSFMKKWQGRMPVCLFILLILASLAYISAGRIREISLPDAHDEALNRVIAAIPDGATVTASNDIFPHLSSRTDTYLPHWATQETGIKNGIWGFPDRDTEYVVVDRVHKQYYIRGYWEDVIINDLNNKYELIMDIDGAKLYRLRQSALPSR